MLILTILPIFFSLSEAKHKYLHGNALESFDTKSPEGEPYPKELINTMFERGDFGPIAQSRSRSRSLFENTLNPALVTKLLLSSQMHHGALREGRKPRSSGDSLSRSARQIVFEDEDKRYKPTNDSTAVEEEEEEVYSNATDSEAESREGLMEGLFVEPDSSCDPTPPAQLCPTKFNTTAPLWGISLTSGERVTIVQKFPDLLQQVIFHQCMSDNCDVLHGVCRQTFTPYLFLVIPLGPVTLTGQDYVMIESGCACQPKYSIGRPYDYSEDLFKNPET